APTVGEGARRIGSRTVLQPTAPARGRCRRRARARSRRTHPLRRGVPPPDRRRTGRPNFVSGQWAVDSEQKEPRESTAVPGAAASFATRFFCPQSTAHCPLSIVIPSHSRPDLLRLCLASVWRFAPQGTEVIVVD